MSHCGCINVFVVTDLQGSSTVQVTVIGISMACTHTSIIFTVYAGCPARHRLNFLYPVILPVHEWISNATDTARIIHHLPVRYFLYCISNQCNQQYNIQLLLPRYMKCRRGLAMRILSFRPSVCLSNVCIVTKRNKDLSRFLYPTKYHIDQFSEKKNCWWGLSLQLEIWGQLAPVGEKSPILNRYSLVALQLYHLAKKVQLTLIGSSVVK